ncbi:putative transcription factor GRF family [Arabidopsis thaliana]
MGDRRRGFPTSCRCDKAVKMGTSRTAKTPGRLFHSCPNGSNECMIEDLKLKMSNVEEDSITLQKGFNACESEIENLQMETHICEAVLKKEIFAKWSFKA